jgi:hypothetical protein
MTLNIVSFTRYMLQNFMLCIRASITNATFCPINVSRIVRLGDSFHYYSTLAFKLSLSNTSRVKTPPKCTNSSVSKLLPHIDGSG